MNINIDRQKYGLYFSDNDGFKFIKKRDNFSPLRFSLIEKSLPGNIEILQLEVKNNSSKTIYINSFLVTEFVLKNFELTEILENGWQQCSFSGYRNFLKPTKVKRIFLARDQNPFSFKKDYGYLDNSMVNEFYAQLGSKEKSIVIGAVTIKDQFTQIYLRKEKSGIRVRVTCQCDQLPLPPGKILKSEKIAIVEGSKNSTLEKFAALLKSENEIEKLPKPITALCCAYYAQGNKVDEKYLLNQLKTIDKLPRKTKLDFIEIDEGYCTRGDWLDSEKQFPSGMGYIVNEIKKRKMKAGIWIAPFVASRTSKLFKKHPDWFLKNNEGEYLEGRFTSPFDFLPFLSLRVLDPTHPNVQEYLKKVTKQFKDFGFELIKIDFVYPICFTTNFYKKMTRNQAIRAGFEIIKKAAGENIYLLSGISPLSPLVGILDFCRIGLDTTNPFVYPFPIIRNLVNNFMLSENLRNCEARQFLNNYIWINDADCLVLNSKSGLNANLVKKHESFIKKYRGNIWLGDDLSKLNSDQIKSVSDLTLASGTNIGSPA